MPEIQSPPVDVPEKATTKKKSTSLPTATVEYLKAWMMSPEHVAHPYPTEQEKAQIMADTGIEQKQLTNWFVNNRKRYWKPRVEARLQQQAQAQAVAAAIVVRCGSDVVDETRTGCTPQQPFVALESTQSGTRQVLTPIFVGGQHSALQTQNAFHHFNHDDARARTPVTLQHHQHTEPARAVSVGSEASLASDSDNNSVGDDYDNNNNNNNNNNTAAVPSVVSMHHSADGQSPEIQNEEEKDTESCAITRHEVADVHVLTSSGEEPSQQDVNILPNVPSDRVIKTYSGCGILFSLTQSSKLDKTEMNRDEEIVRVEKQCLGSFLAEKACLQSGDNVCASKRARAVSYTGCSEYDDSSTENRVTEEASPLKRIRTDSDDLLSSPRKCFLGKSTQHWRDVCRNASHCYDVALPTLEEAAHLFGYAP